MLCEWRKPSNLRVRRALDFCHHSFIKKSKGSAHSLWTAWFEPTQWVIQEGKADSKKFAAGFVGIMNSLLSKHAEYDFCERAFLLFFRLSLYWNVDRAGVLFLQAFIFLLNLIRFTKTDTANSSFSCDIVHIQIWQAKVNTRKPQWLIL